MNKIFSRKHYHRPKMLAVAISILFSFWLLARVVPDGDKLISTMEVFVLIPLPLALFYGRNNWSLKIWMVNIIVLMLLWLFTYSLLHELSHIAGSLLLGSKITAYQLVPKFWEGEFSSGAGVASEPTNKWGITLGFLPGLAPYIRDIVFLIVGCVVLKAKKITNSFLVGLVFILFCLSPLFDIANNYFAYVMEPTTVGNDFQGTAAKIGLTWTNLIGILFTGFAAYITCRIIWLYKDFPKKQFEQSSIPHIESDSNHLPG